MVTRHRLKDCGIHNRRRCMLRTVWGSWRQRATPPIAATKDGSAALLCLLLIIYGRHERGVVRGESCLQQTHPVAEHKSTPNTNTIMTAGKAGSALPGGKPPPLTVELKRGSNLSEAKKDAASPCAATSTKQLRIINFGISHPVTLHLHISPNTNHHVSSLIYDHPKPQHGSSAFSLTITLNKQSLTQTTPTIPLTTRLTKARTPY